MPSGYVCLLTLDRWADWQQRVKRATWGEFQKLLSADVRWPHPKLPFLFAGRMLEASSASVYCSKEGGQVTGLLLSSSDSGD